MGAVFVVGTMLVFAGGMAFAAPLSEASPRRLNNLVTEWAHVDLATSGEGTVALELPRERWVYVAVRGESRPPDALEVRLDGETVVRASTPRLEAVRELPAGRHAVSVSGVRTGELVVRTIPEIMVYSVGVDFSVPQPQEKLDWAFQEKYLFPAVTTVNGGKMPDDKVAAFRATGRQWLANLNSMHLKDDDEIGRRLSRSPGMTDAKYDGVTCDEQILNKFPESLERYGTGLMRYEREAKPTRKIYTWHASNPTSHAAFYSNLTYAAVHASGGRGRYLHETYCRTQEKESLVEGYFAEFIRGKVERLRADCPFDIASYGVVFGVFNQLTRISLTYQAEVDYKYFLDLQMRYVANEPTFDGLGLVGLYGLHYSDPDAARWALRLLRHYFIDGATELLSPGYGFRYIPGHLANGDFRSGLDGWRTSGNVTTNFHRGFGDGAQKRWGGCGTNGDRFAVLTRGADAASELRQTAKGLVPGRTYSLQAAVADWHDVETQTVAPRRLALKLTLGAGAEVLPGRSYVYVDDRPRKVDPADGAKKPKRAQARINLHKVYFIARAPEVDVVFSDADAKPGEAFAVNGVSLNPCYEENQGGNDK